MGGEQTANDPAEAYEGLRTLALGAESALPIVEGSSGEVAGLVVDIPAGQDGFATLVGLRDGTSSLYLSTGGGIIGAGFHEPVRTAVSAVLATVGEYLPDWSLDADTGHPPAGVVRFFALTSAGRRVKDVPEAAFWGRERHELTPLIATVQALISAVRAVAPE